MKWLTLSMIKAHSRIEYDCEDGNLERYGNAAEELILNICGTTYDRMIEEYTTIPYNIQLASLQLVEHWYTQGRSATSVMTVSVVPYTIDVLIKPYMKLVNQTYGI